LVRGLYVGLALVGATSQNAASQTLSASPPAPTGGLDDMTVTATGTPKAELDVPGVVDVVSRDDIVKRRQSRSVPEALKETPGVMVQKTAHGQGSPFIRGFTGFRTLFLIDGVRLNNSVFRDGPNQYWSTVDVLAIDRLEVVKGPSSVLYGSDAIGGTVNAIGRTPPSFDSPKRAELGAYLRYAEAEHATTGRLEGGGVVQSRVGYAVGGTRKVFGDVRGGKETGNQPKTGYDESSVDLKSTLKLDANARLTLAHQAVRQDDVWRTHRTTYGRSWEGTDVGKDRRLSTDQARDLTYLQYERREPGALFQGAKASLSYHVQREDEARTKEDGSDEEKGLAVHTAGASAQLEMLTGLGLWTYGVEQYVDHVSSYAVKLDEEGEIKSRAVQGAVADRSTYELGGIYVQDDILVGDSTTLVPGLRFNVAKAKAGRFAEPETGEEESFTKEFSATVGSFRAMRTMGEARRFTAFTGVSQGFRAPNLSDLTRLDTAKSGELETAAPDLDSERFTAYELGVKASFPAWTTQAAVYHTAIDGLIVRTPTGETIGEAVEVTKRNAGDGYVRGVELDASARVSDAVAVSAAYTFMEGEVDTYPTADAEKERRPMSKVMPATTNLAVRWDVDRARSLWTEAAGVIAARQGRLSPEDELDTQRIPPGGTPGYRILHVRAGVEVIRGVDVSLAVENFTNADYRTHGSGQNEPGSNLIATLRGGF
jgi:hemoglobin/transferrin/lactoferrin receptor protein